MRDHTARYVDVVKVDITGCLPTGHDPEAAVPFAPADRRSAGYRLVAQVLVLAERRAVRTDQKFGLFLCVQDLSCPGYSFLHSASLAARIPTVAAIEGNGRQYCPAANKPWAKRFPTMFEIKDGTVGTAALNGEGLGF